MIDAARFVNQGGARRLSEVVDAALIGALQAANDQRISTTIKNTASRGFAVGPEGMRVR